MRPRARQEGLIVEELDDELLVYDLDRDKAHSLNGAAAVIWGHCDGSRTIEELGALIAPEADEELRAEVARSAVSQLSRRGLLTNRVSGELDVSRRELMRKAAIAGAIALSFPVIKSIVAPTAAQAATCIPSGGSCTANAQCCSGTCVDDGINPPYCL